MKKLIIGFSLVLSSMAFGSYEDHFPAYFEYCGGTQWKLTRGDVGGSPGHGFNYVHGLCKDYTSSYPQVIPCSKVSPELSNKYPHNGVGISLDKNFSNVSWVAVPGRDLLMFGNKERTSIKNQDVADIIEEVTKLKVFNDVVLKPEHLRNLEFNSPEYLRAAALDTLGTDYAVNWARELHCVRIPFPENVLEKLSTYLNEQNNQYRTGPGYNWDKVKNNCAHLSINMSNVIGINKPIVTDKHIVRQVFNLALPSNVFMNYADLGVVDKVTFRGLKKSVKADNFHPQQVGSLLIKYEVYPSGDHFDTDNLDVLTLPRISKPLRLLSTPRKYEKYMTPETVELRANAEMWLNTYEKFISKNKNSDGQLSDYLEAQLDLTQKILQSDN